MFRRVPHISLLALLAFTLPVAANNPYLARQAARELAKEAHAALKEGKPFPRTEPDYAKTGAALSRTDVRRLLTKQLDPTPAVDAYIKWQLLSYEPDFSEMSPGQALRLIPGIPAFEEAGQLKPDDHAFVQRYANRGRITAAQSRRLIELGQRFHHEQAAIRKRNEPNEAYRKALIEALPEAHGVKLFAMIRDAAQRMRACDRGWNSSVDRMLEKCQQLGQAGTMSKAEVSAAKRLIRELKQIGRTRYVNFKPAAGHRVDVTTQRVVFGDRRLRRAYDALDGKPVK